MNSLRDSFLKISSYYIHIPAIVMPAGMMAALLLVFNISDFNYVEDVNYPLIAIPITLTFFFTGIFFFKKNSETIKINKIDLMVFMYFFYVAVNKFFTLGSLYDYYFILLSLCVLCYFIVKEYIRIQLKKKSGNMYFFFYAFYTIVIIELLHGLMQATNMVPDLKYSPFVVGGVFCNPGAYANFIVILLPYSVIGLFFLVKSKSMKICSLLVMLLSLFLLVVSQSRTAWIACIALTIFILKQKYSFSKYLWKLKNIYRFIIIGLCCIAFLGGGSFLYKYKLDSANGRLFIWENSLKLIQEKPLLGHGFSMFHKEFSMLQCNYFINNKDSSYAMLAGEVRSAFNDYLEIAVDFGAIGLIIFIFMIIVMIKPFFLKNALPVYNQHLFQAAGLSNITALICSLFSYPLHTGSILIMFFFNSAVIAAYYSRSIIKATLSMSIIRLVSAFCITGFMFFLIHHINVIKSIGKWKQAVEYINQRKLNEAETLFSDSYPKLRHNYRYLQSYGSYLQIKGDYAAGIECLKKTTERLYNKDIFLFMGHCYMGLNETKKAEECYFKACHFVPYLFVPKSYLFNLYRKTNNIPKALELAHEIVIQKVKVYSPEVGKIKSDAARFINEYEKEQINPEELN